MPPCLRESVWGPFILAYLVPGTWCLGVWSRASIQYPVYRILDTVSQIRTTYKGGGIKGEAEGGGRRGKGEEENKLSGLPEASRMTFLQPFFFIDSILDLLFSVFDFNLATC